MQRFLAVMMVTLFCGPTFGVGMADHFLIDYVRADASGKAFVRFTTPLTDTPAPCSGTTHKDLAFDTNTDAGRAVYSLLLAAKTSGARVTARGTGTCTVYPSFTEDWNFGQLE
jgi:hypothetical protein